MIPRLSLGVEYNPRSDGKSVLANLVAVTETKLRPALVIGTSSDRIGTSDGRAIFGGRDVRQVLTERAREAELRVVVVTSRGQRKELLWKPEY